MHFSKNECHEIGLKRSDKNIEFVEALEAHNDPIKALRLDKTAQNPERIFLMVPLVRVLDVDWRCLVSVPRVDTGNRRYTYLCRSINFFFFSSVDSTSTEVSTRSLPFVFTARTN